MGSSRQDEPSRRRRPKRRSCPCHRIERQPPFIGEQPPTIELYDRAKWWGPPKWGLTKVRCRDHGLVLEEAGYCDRGLDHHEYRMADEGVARFLELVKRGELTASRRYVEEIERRLSTER